MHDSGKGHKWDAQEAHLQVKDTETQESPAPTPKIHQRKQMAQPHPSPSKTQHDSSIITIPNQPANPQTPPVAPHHHIWRSIYEVRQSQCHTHLQKPETTNPWPAFPLTISYPTYFTVTVWPFQPSILSL